MIQARGRDMLLLQLSRDCEKNGETLRFIAIYNRGPGVPEAETNDSSPSGDESLDDASSSSRLSVRVASGSADAPAGD